MAANWTSDSVQLDELGNPFQMAIDYQRWEPISRQLGFSGVAMVNAGDDGIQPTPEFRNFVDQKRAEGYDFVIDFNTIGNRTKTYGLRLPSGEVVNQQKVKVSGFGDFFKEFLLPAAGIAFGMGGLNSLMGGGAAAAPANALTGAGLGAMEGVGLSGNIVNAATGQTIASLPASLTAADIGRGLGDVLGQAGQAPAVEAVDLASMGSLPPPLSPEIQELILSETLPASAAAPAMGSLPPPLPPGIQNLISSETLPASAASRTGIPALDKAIDLVTSPAGQAVVGAAGSVAGGVMQANAAEAAANQQAEAARNALQLQREMFEYQKGLLEPYRTAGTAALKRLEGALGLGGTAQAQQMLEMDPGYGFRLGEGMKALERMQAARGNMLSGGALKAGQRYAQDYASGEYDRAFGRLADIAGIGRSTAAQQGTAAQQFGTSAGNVMGQEANALAAGRIGRGSAYSGAIQGGLNAFQNYFNRQQEEQLFRDIFGRTAVGG